jgi:hypothetical protein
MELSSKFNLITYGEKNINFFFSFKLFWGGDEIWILSIGLCDEIIHPQTVTQQKENQHIQRSTQQCIYSNLLKRHGKKILYFLMGSIKQSCIKYRIFSFQASMAGSELLWLASGYLLVVENGLLDEISSSDMEIWLATS